MSVHILPKTPSAHHQWHSTAGGPPGIWGCLMASVFFPKLQEEREQGGENLRIKSVRSRKLFSRGHCYCWKISWPTAILLHAISSLQAWTEVFTEQTLLFFWIFIVCLRSLNHVEELYQISYLKQEKHNICFWRTYNARIHFKSNS